MNETELSQLELQDEAYSKQVSIEEKKALIAEAKKRHGKDWTRMLNVKSGMNWEELKFKLG